MNHLAPPLAALLMLGATTAMAEDAKQAEESEKRNSGTFSFVLENDLFFDTDRNYTNGARFSYFSARNDVPAIMRGLADRTVGLSGDDAVHWGVAVGQNMYTPDDIAASRPLPDQHPYAGWLYAGASVVVDRRSVVDTVGVTVGMVGPAAMAEQAQKTVHEIIDSQDPKGWDNQLENEPGLMVSYDRKWRALWESEPLGLEFDVTPNAGFTLGNVRTEGYGGVMLRLGRDLADDYGPPRIRPSVAGSDYFEPISDFSWYLFGGVLGRGVAHNIFLDGNTFEDSQSVDRRPWVGDVQFGLAVQLLDVQVAWTAVYRTEEYEEQRDAQTFGAVSISTKF